MFGHFALFFLYFMDGSICAFFSSCFEKFINEVAASMLQLASNCKWSLPFLVVAERKVFYLMRVLALYAKRSLLSDEGHRRSLPLDCNKCLPYCNFPIMWRIILIANVVKLFFN
jgi:hypothetical protein